MTSTSELSHESVHGIKKILRTEYGWEDKDFVPPDDCYDEQGNVVNEKYECWLRCKLVSEIIEREKK